VNISEIIDFTINYKLVSILISQNSSHNGIVRIKKEAARTLPPYIILKSVF